MDYLFENQFSDVLSELAYVIENASLLLHAAATITDEVVESFTGLVAIVCKGFLNLGNENDNNNNSMHSCLAILMQFLSLMIKNQHHQIEMLSSKNFSFAWLQDSPRLPDFCPIPDYSKCSDLLNQSMLMICDFFDSNIFIKEQQDCINLVLQSAMMELASTIRISLSYHLAWHNATDRHNFDLPQFNRRKQHRTVGIVIDSAYLNYPYLYYYLYYY